MIAAREYDCRSKTSYAPAAARILPGWIFGNDASMNSIKATAILAMPVLAAATAMAANVFAQEAKAPAKDYDQRALEIYEFRKAAASGPERGQEIFYYKCWFCHNEFVQGIPQLTGLYQKPNLLSGESVNDDTVKEKIRNGGAGMAAYKYTLSDADLNDLVSYLREKCCWDSDTPPLNPRYRMR
jgi:mono/diheme cytochrome c family protein